MAANAKPGKAAAPENLALPGFDALLAPKKPKRNKPIHVKVGQTAVPIYPMGNRWCIVWRATKGGKRERLTRVSLAEAKEEAEKICLRIATGHVSSGRLTPDQLLQAATALQIIEPLQLTLDGLAREAESAIQTAGGASLAEMARFWARHHAAADSRATVADIHAELLTSKKDRGLSARYWRGLDKDLDKFSAAFSKRPIGDIRSKEILEYLRGLRFTRKHQIAPTEAGHERPIFEIVTHEAGWRRRNNVHSQIVTLFRFAKDQDHLAQDRDTEAEKIPKLTKPRNAPPPRIFTPEDLTIVLNNVKKEWLPWVVLGAFAGLRTAEIERLEWRDILFEDSLIHIREAVAKRTSRKAGDARYVPMSTNLLAWLQPYMEEKGLVCSSRRSDRETGRLGKLLPGGKWGNNPLRHSWISYRAAETANLPQVADEAGNSTEISRTAYRNPRMKREAIAWFAIMPACVPGNVISLPRSA